MKAKTSIVRDNLMSDSRYRPYCGNLVSRLSPTGCENPRTVFNGQQFKCPKCLYETNFPKDFIKKYKEKWRIK